MPDAPFDPRTARGYDERVDSDVHAAEPMVIREPYPVMRNGAGTAALVLGIVGVLTAIIFVGGVLGLLAVVLGLIGLGRVNRREATNRGSAMAGVILGLIAMAISITIGVFAYRNRNDVKNLNDCLRNAKTTTAQSDCQTQFKDAVTK